MIWRVFRHNLIIYLLATAKYVRYMKRPSQKGHLCSHEMVSRQRNCEKEFLSTRRTHAKTYVTFKHRQKTPDLRDEVRNQQAYLCCLAGWALANVLTRLAWPSQRTSVPENARSPQQQSRVFRSMERR